MIVQGRDVCQPNYTTQFRIIHASGDFEAERSSFFTIHWDNVYFGGEVTARTGFTHCELRAHQHIYVIIYISLLSS